MNYFITHVRWKINNGFSGFPLRYNAELPDEVIEVLTIFKHLWEYVIKT